MDKPFKNNKIFGLDSVDTHQQHLAVLFNLPLPFISEGGEGGG